jgi:hypothetical protein
MCVLLAGKYTANPCSSGVAYLKDSMNGEAVMHEAKMWEKLDKRN